MLEIAVAIDNVSQTIISSHVCGVSAARSLQRGRSGWPGQQVAARAVRGHVPAAEIRGPGDVSAVFLGRSDVQAAGPGAPVLSEAGGKTPHWPYAWEQEGQTVWVTWPSVSGQTWV